MATFLVRDPGPLKVISPHVGCTECVGENAPREMLLPTCRSGVQGLMPIGYKCQDDESKSHRAPEPEGADLWPAEILHISFPGESSSVLFSARPTRGFSPLFSLPGVVVVVVISRLLQLIRPKTLDTGAWTWMITLGVPERAVPRRVRHLPCES